MAYKYDRSLYRGGHAFNLTEQHIVVTYQVNQGWFSIIEFHAQKEGCYAYIHVPLPVPDYAFPSEQAACDAAADMVAALDTRRGWRSYFLGQGLVS